MKETTRPTCDPNTGRLKELTYDGNANGRIDTWTDLDGTRALRSRIDRDEDGKVDRWEYYDEAGKLVKVGFSRRGDGKPDAWARSGADGKITLAWRRVACSGNLTLAWKNAPSASVSATRAGP